MSEQTLVTAGVWWAHTCRVLTRQRVACGRGQREVAALMSTPAGRPVSQGRIAGYEQAVTVPRMHAALAWVGGLEHRLVVTRAQQLVPVDAWDRPAAGSLRRLRETAGVSHRRLRELTGMSLAEVQGIDGGRVQPRVTYWAAVVCAIGWTPQVLPVGEVAGRVDVIADRLAAALGIG